MDAEFRQRLEQLENRVALLERNQDLIAAGQRRSSLRSLWRRPPMWTFEQYPPRLLNLTAFLPAPAIHSGAPRIAMVTPSYNHAQYLGATIDSIVSQNYPDLYYHVQDGASIDGTLDLLKGRGDSLSWSSEPDKGQSSAINLGFAGVESEIMAYLNSDDVLLPGTLAYVANYFIAHPHVDVVYGHRVFIDREGLEVGRAVLPPHDGKALRYADYIPQETMFWRKRVWDRIGPIDESLHYAMDWDFILRAQPQDSNLHACRDFSPASESMTHKRRRPPMRSASGRWASCGDAFSASNRHRCRSGAPSLLIWRSSWPITTPTSSAC